MARLSVGDIAPGFELPGTGGHTYTLEAYRGTGLILAFYPGDFTLVCTRQFCSYRDDAERLAGLGVEVLGISPQSVSSHERFASKHDIQVPLLADEDKSTAREYGVLGVGGLVRRSIFVIDGDLRIRHCDVKTLGLTYEDVGALERAVAKLS